MLGLVRLLLKRVHVYLRRLVRGRPPEDLGFPTQVYGEDFHQIVRACKPYTGSSIERMYALYQAVKYCVANDIPGSFVECGVFRGGSSMVIAQTLRTLGRTDRDIYLFDTYEGMPVPGTNDYRVGDASINTMSQWKKMRDSNHNAWCYCSLDEVRRNMLSTGYPGERVHLIKGMVEDTIPSQAPPRWLCSA